MNPNSVPLVATTATAMTAAQVAPVIQWAWAHCPSPIPDGVALTLAAVVLIIIHWGYRAVASLIPGPKPAQPVLTATEVKS